MNSPSQVIILWEFFVKEESEQLFFNAYNAKGIWVQLFQNGKGYIKTELWKDAKQPFRFVTADYWNSELEYRAFQTTHRDEYETIDKLCDGFSERENFIGIFEIDFYPPVV